MFRFIGNNPREVALCCSRCDRIITIAMTADECLNEVVGASEVLVLAETNGLTFYCDDCWDFVEAEADTMLLAILMHQSRTMGEPEGD